MIRSTNCQIWLRCSCRSRRVWKNKYDDSSMNKNRKRNKKKREPRWQRKQRRHGRVLCCLRLGKRRVDGSHRELSIRSRRMECPGHHGLDKVQDPRRNYNEIHRWKGEIWMYAPVEIVQEVVMPSSNGKTNKDFETLKKHSYKKKKLKSIRPSKKS